MQRLNLTGAISIGLLAVIPLIAERFVDSSALSFGGTSLIITVSVALETIRQLRSKALMYSYDLQNDSLERSFGSSEEGEDDKSRGFKRLKKVIIKPIKFKKHRKVNNKSKK